MFYAFLSFSLSVGIYAFFFQAGKGGDLTHDETTIIAGALEMTQKTAKVAMTPISNAFSLDLDTTLDLWVCGFQCIATLGFYHSRMF